MKVSIRLDDTWEQIKQVFSFSHDELESMGLKNIIYTENLKRLACVVHKCLVNKEPVLLVGETGCGKTTIC